MRVNKFKFVLLILAIVFTLIISTLLLVLWSYLEDYEKSTPQFYIDNFLENIKNGDANSVLKLAGFSESSFFKAKDYKEYLNNIIDSNTNVSDLPVNQIESVGNKTIYEITGKDNKKIKIELTQNSEKSKSDKYSIKHIDLPLKSMTVYAPSHIKISANGEHISPQETATVESKDGFSGINNSNLTYKQSKYVIEDFIAQPKLSVNGLAESEYSITSDDKNTYITTSIPASLKQEFEEFAENAIITYSKFVSREATFQAVAQYLYKDSEYYKVIRAFDNYWYIEHDKAEFKNMKFEDSFSYSDIHFSTIVSFEHIVTKGRIVNTYHSKYKIYIVKFNNKFKIVNISNV